MSDNRDSKPAKTTHRMRRFVIYVALLAAAFLLGFVPMWLTSRDDSARLSDATRQLDRVGMENSLASAAVDARLGNYETARQAASDFFTRLRVETDKGVESVLSQAQKDGVQPLLEQRDQIITLLARGDIASAELLSSAYVSFREVMSK
jgi:hypothetical protein